MSWSDSGIPCWSVISHFGGATFPPQAARKLVLPWLPMFAAQRAGVGCVLGNIIWSSGCWESLWSRISILSAAVTSSPGRLSHIPPPSIVPFIESGYPEIPPFPSSIECFLLGRSKFLSCPFDSPLRTSLLQMHCILLLLRSLPYTVAHAPVFRWTFTSGTAGRRSWVQPGLLSSRIIPIVHHFRDLGPFIGTLWLQAYPRLSMSTSSHVASFHCRVCWINCRSFVPLTWYLMDSSYWDVILTPLTRRLIFVASTNAAFSCGPGSWCVLTFPDSLWPVRWRVRWS